MIPTGYKVSINGEYTDLKDVFRSYYFGNKVANTGFTDPSKNDLATLFQPINDTKSNVALTGFLSNSKDLSTLFMDINSQANIQTSQVNSTPYSKGTTLYNNVLYGYAIVTGVAPITPAERRYNNTNNPINAGNTGVRGAGTTVNQFKLTTLAPNVTINFILVGGGAGGGAGATSAGNNNGGAAGGGAGGYIQGYFTIKNANSNFAIVAGGGGTGGYFGGGQGGGYASAGGLGGTSSITYSDDSRGYSVQALRGTNNDGNGTYNGAQQSGGWCGVAKAARNAGDIFNNTTNIKDYGVQHEGSGGDGGTGCNQNGDSANAIGGSPTDATLTYLGNTIYVGGGGSGAYNKQSTTNSGGGIGSTGGYGGSSGGGGNALITFNENVINPSPPPLTIIMSTPAYGGGGGGAAWGGKTGDGGGGAPGCAIIWWKYYQTT